MPVSFAERLAVLPGIEIDPATVHTNIVIFDISALGIAPSEFSQLLKSKGLLANGVDASRMRLVTHLDASREDCERAADVLAEVITKKPALSVSV